MADPVDRLRAAIGREPFLAAELSLLAGLALVLVGVLLPDPYGLAAIGVWLALPFVLALVMLLRVGTTLVRGVRTGDLEIDSAVSVVRGLWYAVETIVAAGFLIVGANVALLFDWLSNNPNQGEGTLFFAGAFGWFFALSALLTVVCVRLVVTAVWRLRE